MDVPTLVQKWIAVYQKSGQSPELNENNPETFHYSFSRLSGTTPKILKD